MINLKKSFLLIATRIQVYKYGIKRYFFFISFLGFVSMLCSQTKEVILNQDLVIANLESHSYKITLKKRTHLELDVEQNGIDLEVKIKDSKSKEVYSLDSPNGSYGIEKVEFSPMKSDTYTLEVKPLSDHTMGKYRITHFKILSNESYNAKLDSIKKEEEYLSNWIQKNLTPIDTCIPVSEFPALNLYEDKIKQSQIIGLGEATHGSRENYLFKI